MIATAYLQHSAGPNGPFRTEAVRVKHEYADRYKAFYEGKWRRVHVQVKKTFIKYQGQQIKIIIEGL
jgi:hypothetical protein